jgi:hypothetical protein
MVFPEYRNDSTQEEQSWSLVGDRKELLSSPNATSLLHTKQARCLVYTFSGWSMVGRNQIWRTRPRVTRRSSSVSITAPMTATMIV